MWLTVLAAVLVGAVLTAVSCAVDRWGRVEDDPHKGGPWPWPLHRHDWEYEYRDPGGRDRPKHRHCRHCGRRERVRPY